MANKKPDIDVLIVRSGRTRWELEHRVQGSTDLPICPEGESAVVAAMDDELGSAGAAIPAVVLTAPDESSRRTAARLADRTQAKVRALDALAPMCLGLWEGLFESELQERYPRAYKQWRADPSAVTPPEGDTLVAAERRVFGGLARAVEKAGGKPVALVLRPIEYARGAARFTGRPLSDVWSLLQDGPTVTRLTVPASAFRAHLDGLKTAAA